MKFNTIYKNDYDLIKRIFFPSTIHWGLCVCVFFSLGVWFKLLKTIYKKDALSFFFYQFTQFFAIVRFSTQTHATQRVLRFQSNTFWWLQITKKNCTFQWVHNKVVRMFNSYNEFNWWDHLQDLIRVKLIHSIQKLHTFIINFY